MSYVNKKIFGGLVRFLLVKLAQKNADLIFFADTDQTDLIQHNQSVVP